MADVRVQFDDAILKRIMRDFRKETKETLDRSMARSFEHIGLLATGDFMRPGPDTLTHPTQLTHRTGRLGRSLTGGFSFNEFASGNRGDREGIRKIRRINNAVVGEYGTKVPYANIHEYGGKIRITEASRRFFWYMFYETGIPAWKNMALTRKSHFVVPARPFFRPAVAKARPDVFKFFQEEIEMLIARAQRG